MSPFAPRLHRPDPCRTGGRGGRRAGAPKRGADAVPLPPADYPKGSTRRVAVSSVDVIVVVLPSVCASVCASE